MAPTIASELDETVIPPPLDASCSSALELHSITEAGGKAYFELLSTWKTCLFGSKTPPDDALSTATPAQLAASLALRLHRRHVRRQPLYASDEASNTYERATCRKCMPTVRVAHVRRATDYMYLRVALLTTCA